METFLFLLYIGGDLVGRMVKCKICKTKGDSDVFFRVTNEKGVNSYYCNQDEYEHMINEQQKRYDLLKYVAEDILAYEDGQIVPPSMVKKIGQLNEFYDFEVIYETFKQNKETIQYWINTKGFTSEYGMASYVMKIIEGNINDIYKSWKYKKQQEVKQENTFVDVELIEQMNEVKTVTKSDDGISGFLDEEDM